MQQNIIDELRATVDNQQAIIRSLQAQLTLCSTNVFSSLSFLSQPENASLLTYFYVREGGSTAGLIKSSEGVDTDVSKHGQACAGGYGRLLSKSDGSKSQWRKLSKGLAKCQACLSSPTRAPDSLCLNAPCSMTGPPV